MVCAAGHSEQNPNAATLNQPVGAALCPLRTEKLSQCYNSVANALIC